LSNANGYVRVLWENVLLCCNHDKVVGLFDEQKSAKRSPSTWPVIPPLGFCRLRYHPLLTAASKSLPPCKRLYLCDRRLHRGEDFEAAVRSGYRYSID